MMITAWRQYVRERLPRLHASPEREIDIVEELAAQLEATYARARASGATHDEALQAAAAEVPDWDALARTLDRVEPPGRAVPVSRGPTWSLAGILDDARFALRAMASWRGNVAAMVMLGLSTGALLVVMAVLDAWMFRPTVFARPDRLAIIWGTNHAIGQARDVVSGPTYLDWQRQSQSFTGLAAFAESELTIRVDGHADVVGTMAVTPEFFDVLGVQATAGRTFQAADLSQASGVVMISHATWQSRFGGDPNIAGRTLKEFGQPHVIIGVLPAGFALFSSPDVVTLLDPRTLEKEARSYYYYWVVGRLRDGRRLVDAQAELDMVMSRLATQHSGVRGWTATVEGLFETMAEPVRPALVTLLSIAALVLAISVANTINLVLSRAQEKRRDIAIRSALGATSARLRRQSVLEGAWLSLAGASIGVALATIALRLLGSFGAASASIAGSAATVALPAPVLDGSSLALAAALALFLTAVLGALPLRAADAALTRLRQTAAVIPLTRGRQALLAGQTAIATLLVAVAGLLFVLVLNLISTSPGFDASRVNVMIVGRVHDLTAPERARYYTDLLRAVSATPGVSSAAVNDYVPLTNEDDYEGVEVPGRPRDAAGQLPREEWRRVSTGYFQTMGVPLVRGRFLTEADDERAASVVVINEAMARKYWGPGSGEPGTGSRQNEDVIGSRIRITSPRYGWSEVVGVVGDIREAGLDRPAKPMMFVPYHRDPRPVMALFVQTSGVSDALMRAAQQAVSSVDPTRPVFHAQPMRRIVEDSYAVQRATLWVAAVLAALALILMLGGTYAIVNLVSAGRTAEMGIRVALGAGAGDILRAVLGRPCAAAAAGMVVGMAAAFGAAGLLQARIAGVPPLDGAMVAGVVVLVGLAVGAACAAPARRALGTDPAMTLRSE